MESQQPTRQEILAAARCVIGAAAQCVLSTIGPDGAPQARMMDPFALEDDFTVWMATNRDTRKVAELRRDDRATLTYFDRDNPGYATLIGKVRLVDDIVDKKARWKEAWDSYYPGGAEGDSYLLMEFVPDRLEVVSVAHRIAAEPLAWKAAVVLFDRRAKQPLAAAVIVLTGATPVE